jgi:hypothetical protein
MVDSKQRSTTLKKLARWTPSSSASLSDGQRKPRIPPLSNDAPFVHVHHDKLQQGALYIIKIKQVSLAMFEGKYMRIKLELRNRIYNDMIKH